MTTLFIIVLTLIGFSTLLDIRRKIMSEMARNEAKKEMLELVGHLEKMAEIAQKEVAEKPTTAKRTRTRKASK